MRGCGGGGAGHPDMKMSASLLKGRLLLKKEFALLDDDFQKGLQKALH